MTDYASIHQPVLLEQCVSLVAPALQDPGSIAVDCTLGLAGHTIAFLKAAPQARVLGIDRDAEALAMATERIAGEGLSDRFIPVHAAFDAFGQVLDDQGIDRVNAVFMDLGLSSLQIDETDRGFSYAHDAPLDMRMDVSQPLTAQRVLAEYPERELVRIFRAYGEERFSRQIAREIVRRRAQEPLTTSAQLNRLVDEVVPQAHRPAGNPAKRVFQALRIEVNGELDKLAGTLPQIACRLPPHGRPGGGGQGPGRGRPRPPPAADSLPARPERPPGGRVVSLIGRQDGEVVHERRTARGRAGRHAGHPRRRAAVLRAADARRRPGRAG